MLSSEDKDITGLDERLLHRGRMMSVDMIFAAKRYFVRLRVEIHTIEVKKVLSIQMTENVFLEIFFSGTSCVSLT